MTELLLLVIEGALFASAIRAGGKPCRIVLPDDPVARRALVHAHLDGAPATLTFVADGHEPWNEAVPFVALSALCPRADGR